MAELNSPFLTINFGKITSTNSEESSPIEIPSAIVSKKRKGKPSLSKKTNEELIQQSHQELMKYVDQVDNRVQLLLKEHQGQFLAAYRVHIKKVRQEMQNFKRQSAKNTYSEQAYLDKINTLEKQLAIFREQSLKLFEKIALKDKQLTDLNIKIKDLRGQKNELKKSIYLLTRRNKQLQTAVQKLKQKQLQVSQINNKIQSLQLSKQQQKIYYQPVKNLNITNNQNKYIENERLNHHFNNNLTYGSKSNKFQKKYDLNTIKELLSQRIEINKLVNIDTIFKILAQQLQDNKQYSRSIQSKESKPIRIKRGKSSSIAILQTEIKLKSNQFTERMEYFNIFRDCVQNIRKDIIRRNTMTSINFYKENHSKKFIQFKKLEKYLLLEHFLTNQKVLKKFYQIIFSSHDY